MSANQLEHPEETPHAHDPAEEIAHAKQHAVENIYFFAVFAFLIICAVLYYEFVGASNLWVIFGFAAIRSTLIAGFLFWLMGSFSLVLRTIVFTVFFLGGMVFLSIYDSDLPSPLANPIAITKH